jgi:type I restriction enzyme, S subunit
VKGAGVGKIFPGLDCAIGRDIYAFKPKAGLSVKFIEHAVRFTVQDVLQHAVGDIPGLSKSHILEHEIGLPELKEQENIVAEIEKQFSRLDEAVASLKRTKANLKCYRAAVLKAAVEGKLTEDWRKQHPNVEPAGKLLERILAERRARWNGKGEYTEQTQPDVTDLPELPPGWIWARLDAIASLKGGITVDKNRKSSTARTVPYLRVANVQRGYLELSEVKEIKAPEADIRDLCLEPGDILFNEGGDRDKLGRGWVWEGQLSECIHQNHVFRARLYLADVSPKLVSWWGNSFGQTYFLREGKQTTNLASINITKLSAFPIPFPPAAEQQQIVAEVERRLSVIEELEAAVEANLTRADRLRHSILHIAFSGQLACLRRSMARVMMNCWVWRG